MEIRHTDGRYYPTVVEEQSVTHDLAITHVRSMLDAAKAVVDSYYSEKEDRPTNYEDLYYLVEQVRHCISREYDNPAIQPLVDQLHAVLREPFPYGSWQTTGSWSLGQLADETAHYIRDIVWHALASEPVNTTHLDAIVQCCREATNGRVDIFTLNHDLLLERCLGSSGITYGDGFGEVINRVRYWEKGKLANAREAVRVIKLHGSVDYFAFERRVRGREECVGQVLSKDPDHTLDPRGHSQWTTSWRPVMLVGTFNKFQEYLGGMFLEMYWEFLASLADARVLLVSGYSFGDKGINRPIAHWMHASGDHRLILVTPNPGGTKLGARGAIRNWWDGWESEGRLISFPHGIEALSYGAIEPYVS